MAMKFRTEGDDRVATIAVLLDTDFEDVEYTEPAEALRRAGHRLVHLGLKAGTTVQGKKEATPVTIDRNVEGANVDEFDALLIPGGYSPDRLRVHAPAVAFARDFLNSGKPVFAICHGPQLLITADVLKGRALTGWTSIQRDIENAGARYEDKPVVEEGNLVTSRGPRDLPAFTQSMLARLSGRVTSRMR